MNHRMITSITSLRHRYNHLIARLTFNRAVSSSQQQTRTHAHAPNSHTGTGTRPHVTCTPPGIDAGGDDDNADVAILLGHRK